MAEDNIEIVLLADGENVEINDMFNTNYNDTRTLAMFNWQFMGAPAGPAIYVVAKDVLTKQIVGTQCAIPIDLIDSEGNIHHTAKSEDTLLRPAYRGKNLSKRMYDLLFEECRKKGILYVWGFTTAEKPLLKSNFEIPWGHSQGVYVRHVIPAYNYLVKLNVKNTAVAKFKILGLCIVAKLKAIISGGGNLAGFTTQVFDKSTMPDNQQLVNHQFAPGSNLFTINQNAGFLTWRVQQNPYFSKVYTVCFSSDNGLAGQIVFNYHKDGVWYLITDMYLHSVTNAQRVAMLNKAIAELCQREDVSLIRTWGFAHNAYNTTELANRNKSGFININRGIKFVWRNLDPNNTLVRDNFVLSRIASQGMV